MHRVVVMEARPSTAAVFRDALREAGGELRIAATVEDGTRYVSEGDVSLIFLSSQLAGGQTSDVLAALRRHTPSAPIYLMTAGEETPDVDADLWFEVIREPVRPEVVRWIAEAVLGDRLSRVFKLYVSGRGTHAKGAEDRVRGMLERVLHDGFELEVIDVLREPSRARMDQVKATPTLVRVGAQPRRQVVGVDEARLERVWDPSEVKW